MIVFDIETSGLDKVKCGIWQIGAYDLNSGETFLEEGRIDDEDQAIDGGSKPLIEVIGKTEEDLRNPNKQSQKELIEKFLAWIDSKNSKNVLCMIPDFDVGFLQIKANKYDLKLPFSHRTFDLHSFAQLKFHEINKNFNLKEGKSNLGLDNITKFCGMEDNRNYHNALEDSKLTAECFSRIVYGKNLIEEFKAYPIPSYLK
tara:strand:+ start:296 stop:898 length:603 start_codon:yes stop_codon:yes gene_type:complete